MPRGACMQTVWRLSHCLARIFRAPGAQQKKNVGGACVACFVMLLNSTVQYLDELLMQVLSPPLPAAWLLCATVHAQG